MRKKTETEIKLTGSTLNATPRGIGTSWNREVGMVSNKNPGVGPVGIGSTSVAKSSPNVNLATFVKRGAIPKPQAQFKDKVDNSNLPFLPKLRQKPNAQKSLPG